MMLPLSASDRIENGFFWYVVPTIFSGKSELAIAAPVEIALLRPKSALPVATSSSVPTGPASRSTLLKPASA